jgi:prephenate dehydrogenase
LPVDVNVKMAKQLEPIVSKDCIITDVASTKSDICQAMKSLEINFIGGHPMTGSEKTGYIASDAMIFENAFYIFTKDQETKPSDLAKLEAFTKAIKSLPVIMDTERHDFVTATISHVPHIIASSLVNSVKELDDENGFMHDLAAGGFKSITRIASSSPDIWQHICSTNKENIAKVLDYYIDYLQKIRSEFNDYNENHIYRFFEEAKDYRNSFIDLKPSVLPQYYGITVDVFDKTGSIATIATLLSEASINIKNIGIVRNREHVAGVLEIEFYSAKHMEMAIDLFEKKYYNVYRI